MDTNDKQEHREYMRQWRKNHPDNIKRTAERRAQRRKDNPEQTRLDDARHRNSPEYMHEYHLKTKYRLSAEEWDALYESQDHNCAICLQPVTRVAAQTDHDHKTGQVRAILCKPCNLMLGNASDDPNNLRRAADYIERYRKEDQ